MTVELGVAGVAVGLITGLITVWLFIRPGVRRGHAVADAILGEEAVTDRSKKEIQPARPGLVHRVSEVESAVKTLANIVANQQLLNDRVGELGREQKMHAIRLTSLERNEAERVAIREESAAMWRATADQNVVDVEPEVEP